MEIVAISKNVKISAKKMAPVAKQFKNQTPAKALINLNLMFKKAATPLNTTIKSAVSNAKHNFGIDIDDLVIRRIDVGPGETYKRFRAAARGRIHPILKRTVNIKVVLESKEIKPAKELESKLAVPIENKKTQQAQDQRQEDKKTDKLGKRGNNGTKN